MGTDASAPYTNYGRICREHVGASPDHYVDIGSALPVYRANAQYLGACRIQNNLAQARNEEEMIWGAGEGVGFGVGAFIGSVLGDMIVSGIQK